MSDLTNTTPERLHISPPSSEKMRAHISAIRRRCFVSILIAAGSTAACVWGALSIYADGASNLAPSAPISGLAVACFALAVLALMYAGAQWDLTLNYQPLERDVSSTVLAVLKALPEGEAYRAAVVADGRRFTRYDLAMLEVRRAEVEGLRSTEEQEVEYAALYAPSRS